MKWVKSRSPEHDKYCFDPSYALATKSFSVQYLGNFQSLKLHFD